MKDYCTLWFEKYIKGFSLTVVDISDCCSNHDKTCSTRQFYLCLKDKIGKFHATYIGFGGSIGCWVKYTKKMVKYTKDKFNKG